MSLITRRRVPFVALAFVILFVSGFAVVRANVLGMGERFDRLASRVETLVDPPPDRSTIPTVVVTPAPTAPPPPPSQQTYTVQQGDTLGSIAQQFGTTVAALQTANGIEDPNEIFVGQVLLIA